MQVEIKSMRLNLNPSVIKFKLNTAVKVNKRSKVRINNYRIQKTRVLRFERAGNFISENQSYETSKA